ncbi:MAG: DUF5665 domain-containing protein [Clostridia bacterium]|nr:DUF5665 domain-containing protein [Clostridia bacterium]MDD4146376.1 DUF5665 domain-containing protein [Clostridia bacterium]MDD4665041.1 DUF5665 domain-containing protein [Clostridia bacterium]
MHDQGEPDVIKSLENKLEKLTLAIEKIKMVEYVEFLNNRRRMLYTNFLAGIARGLGMAIGFTILGALLIYLLRQVVLLNLPLIGDFIADIVQLVNESLKK